MYNSFDSRECETAGQLWDKPWSVAVSQAAQLSRQEACEHEEANWFN